MRKVKKPVFFIVLLCIIAFGYLTYAGIHTQYGDIKTSYIKGVEDIRWGIDIQGGVNATFEPADNYDAKLQSLYSERVKKKKASRCLQEMTLKRRR